MFFLLFLLCFVHAVPQYLDNTNTTAWSYVGSDGQSSGPIFYGGSESHPDTSEAGSLTFCGSTVTIYGELTNSPSHPEYKNGYVQFTWANGGTSTFSHIGSAVNQSILYAEGFNPAEDTKISFQATQAEIHVDYAVVDAEPTTTTSPTSQPASSSPATTSPATTTSPTITSLPASATTTPPSPKPPIGAIVGGTIGGIALLLGLLLGFCFFRRRQQSKELQPEKFLGTQESPDQDTRARVPFVPAPNSLTMSAREKQSGVFDDRSTSRPQSNVHDSKLAPRDQESTTSGSSNAALQERLAQVEAELRAVRNRLPPEYE
ncbi:hypothetical protein DL96DRAFT_1610253 [Flagelloscypha sp. PMI_526]|nr:hypothetical protein DL96DRAFT_1610253 [Flagelloscypha sp. PMI_526]